MFKTRSPFLLLAVCSWASCLRMSKAWTEPVDGASVFHSPSYHDGSAVVALSMQGRGDRWMESAARANLARNGAGLESRDQ